jgi:hypothetical protein
MLCLNLVVGSGDVAEGDEEGAVSGRGKRHSEPPK